MVLFYMIPTQFPYLIVETLGGDPKTVGFVIAIAMVFNALIAMQYAKIKARLSYIQIYSATFTFFAIGLFIISYASSIGELLYSTLFTGVAFGLLLVNTNAWFLSKVPANKRGKASGILTSSFFFGQFSSPLIFEPIVTHYGIQQLFFMIGILSVVTAVVLFLYSLRKNRIL